MNAAEFAKRWPSVGHDPNAKPRPVPWLVEGLWLRGKITAILGPEKTGKSRLACWIIAQMLATPAGGVVMTTEAGHAFWRHNGFKKMLYLHAEEQEVDVQARVNAYARSLGFEPSVDWPITYVNAASMQLQRPADRAAFEELYLASGEYDVVFLDPLRRVHAGNENDNSAMAPLHNDLRRWSNKYHTAIIIVHHTGHLAEDADLERIATWSRGNTDLPTLLDGANMMRTLAASSSGHTRLLKRMGRFPSLPDLQLNDYGDPRGWTVSANGS